MQPTPRTKLGLVVISSLALGFAAALFYPERPLPGRKPRPVETPNRQEPSRRPNTSLEPELVCGYTLQRATSSARA